MNILNKYGIGNPTAPLTVANKYGSNSAVPPVPQVPAPVVTQTPAPVVAPVVTNPVTTVPQSTSSTPRDFSNPEVLAHALKTALTPTQQYYQLRGQQMDDRLMGKGAYAVDPNAGFSPSQVEQVQNAGDKLYGAQLDTIAADANKSTQSKFGADSVLAGLTPTGASRVYAISDKFDSSPIVKSYNTVQRSAIDANLLMDKINQDTISGKTPVAGDDLQLIYMFARVQDPESVVREGEYNTVAKYLSTLPQSVRNAVSRVVDKEPSALLTPEARSAVLEGINRKYQSDKTQYDNLYSESVRKINDVAGSDIGSKIITDYSGAYNPKINTNTNQGSTVSATGGFDF